MRKTIVVFFSLLIIVGLSSFGFHKFYVSIYQINYNQKKQMLEITSRILIVFCFENIIQIINKNT